jgi:hypothetical protein
MAEITFRGTVEYRASLQQAALDRGIKVQALLERAVEAFLSGTAIEADKIDPPTKSNSDLFILDAPAESYIIAEWTKQYQQLNVILNSGGVFSTALQWSLEAFALAVSSGEFGARDSLPGANRAGVLERAERTVDDASRIAAELKGGRAADIGKTRKTVGGGADRRLKKEGKK